MVLTGGAQIPGIQDLNGTIINPSAIITQVNAMQGTKGYTLTTLRVVPVDREDNEIQDNSPLSLTRRLQMCARVPVPNQPGWSGVACPSGRKRP